MFTLSLSVFRYRRTYATVVVSVLGMNVLAHLQSHLIGVSRPLSGYILPTLIGGVIGMLISLNQVRCLEKNEEQKRLFIDIVQSLSIALDERDAYTFGHSSRVTGFSLALGRRVGLNCLCLEMLELGSILHDIGKIGIPDTILNKPETLSSEEMELIRQHPVKGERIIGGRKDPKIQLIVDCIRSHHERYDGTGYPDGLAGTEIPELARIVAIADAYDTMTSLRVYRVKLTPQAALDELLRCSGSQFDPDLVRAFSEMMIADDFRLLAAEAAAGSKSLLLENVRA